MIDNAFDAAALHDALVARADTLRTMLEDRIRQNLSGDVLAERSGALLNSITSDLEDGGTDVVVEAQSTGVPYAAILEYGGKTAAHDIVAVKEPVARATSPKSCIIQARPSKPMAI